ncbi:MAG: hypothetical protein AAB701_01280 [Patescibacteria group bacterium]
MKSTTALKIIASPLLVLIISDIAVRMNLYERYELFDVGMHTLGGVSIAVSWMVFEQALFPKSDRPWWYGLIVTLGIVALAATVWEFYEFILDQREMVAWRQLSLADTMGDYAAGLIGGLFVVGWSCVKREYSHEKARSRP